MESYIVGGNQSHTQDRIIDVLKKGKPVKISQIAHEIDVSYQTVHKYMFRLLEHNVAKRAYRKGNSDYFTLGEKLDGLPRVIWQGKSTPIREVLQEALSDGNFPQDHFTPRVLKLMATLFALSAKALENDERIPLGKLKDLQATIANDLDRLKELERVIESLLGDTNLWDPTSLPRELIIRDPRMSPNLAMDMYQQMKEMEN